MQSFIALCLLVFVGHLLRMKVRLLRWLYLPSAVIAGVIGLVAIQCAKGAGTPIPDEWTFGWGKLPGLLINVVFACLFLGTVVPGLRTVWRRAGPQLAYGQVVAWGQYVVGVGLFLVVIQWLAPGLPAMFGGVLPVGFEGGHGTAAGLKDTFTVYGWEAGSDFALASATMGIISAVIVGMALVNWAARKGYATHTRSPGETGGETGRVASGSFNKATRRGKEGASDAFSRFGGSLAPEHRPEAGKLTVPPGAAGSLTIHLAAVGVACLVGWGMREGLRSLGGATGNETFILIMKGFPLFPLCMIGGLLVQLVEQRYDRAKLIDRGLSRLIMNCALDFLVVAAIATIRVEVLYEGLVPFLALVVAGIAWNVFCVVWLARRALPDAWFERSIAEMGQSMGVTATGILLLRVVDPEYETPAADAFACKQILHEPFMGGGLWTSTAIPLLALWGGWPVFGIACGAVAAWLLVLFVVKPFGSARNRR